MDPLWTFVLLSNWLKRGRFPIPTIWMSDVLLFVNMSSLVVDDAVVVVSSLMVLVVDATPGRRCHKSGVTPPRFLCFGFVILLV